MSVLDMKLSDDLAEAIGQVAVNAIIEAPGTMRIDDGTGSHVVTWAANACEQIGRTIMERFVVAWKSGDEPYNPTETTPCEPA